MADPSVAATFRTYAARETAWAAEATLSNVRLIHERSAASWLRLAERADGSVPNR